MSLIDKDLPKREAIRKPDKKISRKKRLSALFKSCEWLLNIPMIDEKGDLCHLAIKSVEPEITETDDFEVFSNKFDAEFPEIGTYYEHKSPVTSDLLNATSKQLFKIRKSLGRYGLTAGYYNRVSEKYSQRYFYFKESLTLTGRLKEKGSDSDRRNADKHYVFEILNLLHLEAFSDYNFTFSPLEWIETNFKTAKHYIADFIDDENNSVFSRMSACALAIREGLHFKYEGENKFILQLIKTIHTTRDRDYDNLLIRFIILGGSSQKVLRLITLLKSYRTSDKLLRLFFRISIGLKNPDFFIEFLSGFYIRLLEFNPENSYYDLYLKQVYYNKKYLQKCSRVFKVDFDVVRIKEDPLIVDILFSHIDKNQLNSIQSDLIYSSGITSQYYENYDLIKSLFLLLSGDLRLFSSDCSGFFTELNFLYSISVLKLIYMVRYEYFIRTRFKKQPDFHSIIDFISWKNENNQISGRIDRLFDFSESHKILYTIFRCSQDLQATVFLLNQFTLNYFAKDKFYSELCRFLFKNPEKLSDLTEKYFYVVKLVRSIKRDASPSERAEFILFLMRTIMNIPADIQDKFIDLVIKGFKVNRYDLDDLIRLTCANNTWIRGKWRGNLLDVLLSCDKKNAYEWIRQDYTTSFLNKLTLLNNENPDAFLLHIVKKIEPYSLNNENYELILEISPVDPRIFLSLIDFVEREDLYVYHLAPVQKIAQSIKDNPARLKKLGRIVHEDPKRWFRILTPLGFLIDIRPAFINTLVSNMFTEYRPVDLSETDLKEFSGDANVPALISELKFYLLENEQRYDLPESLIEVSKIEKHYSDQLIYLNKQLNVPGKTDQVYDELRRRIGKIESKLSDPELVYIMKRANVIKKTKDLINEYRQTYLTKKVDEFITDSLKKYRFKNIDGFQEKIDQEDLLNAIKISLEIDSNRDLAKKLISKYIRGKADYFNSHPKNVEFLRKIQKKGIETDVWMSGFSVSYDKVDLYIETDPVKVLQMGNYFDTCLSQGSGNAFSVITNAIEANKKVIYAKDKKGKIAGRKLIGMTDNGRIVGYKTYSYSDSLDLKKTFDNFCFELSQKCNTRLVNIGSPALIFAEDWYEDSIEPFPVVTFRIIKGLIEQYSLHNKSETLVKAIRKIYRLRNTDYLEETMDWLLNLDLVEYKPTVNIEIFGLFSELPSDRLFRFIVEKAEAGLLKIEGGPGGFFNPYDLARISADLVVPVFIKHKDDIPGIDKVFERYASSKEGMIATIDNLYLRFEDFPFDISDSCHHFLLNPPRDLISEPSMSSIFRKIITCRKYDNLFDLGYEYPKNHAFVSVVYQILESSSPDIQDVINCFRYLYIIQEKASPDYFEKYLKQVSELNKFFLDYVFVTRYYEHLRFFESEVILDWINKHVSDFAALMDHGAKQFYDSFLINRPVILVLLDHVLGSQATPLQKLNSIRAFVKSEENIRKCREVIEHIKSKASQNVYYRKAYQVLKEKELQ